jgi:hypothetical protein
LSGFAKWLRQKLVAIWQERVDSEIAKWQKRSSKAAPPERSPMSPDHTLIVFAIVIPCIVLMGVWAAFEGTRLARGIRSGEF